MDQNLSNVILVAIGSAIPTILGLIVYLMRTRSDTRNEIAVKTNAAQNKIDTAITDALEKVADSNNMFSKSLNEMVQNLREMVLQNNAVIQGTSAERVEQARVLTRTLDRMEGMLSIMDRTEKGQNALTTTVLEVRDGIQSAKTDLREVNVRTAGLPGIIGSAIDERFGIVSTTLVGMGTQINALVAQVTALVAVAQTSGVTSEAISTGIAKVNENLSAIVKEFGLQKEMIFDRDDRIAEILIANNIKSPVRKDSSHDPTQSQTLPSRPDALDPVPVGAGSDQPGAGPGGNPTA